MIRKLFWLLLGAIGALVFFLPLSWVGPKVLPATLTTSATQYKGTIWKGAISNLRDVKRVTYRMKPLKILTGGYPVTTELSSEGLRANAQLGRRHAKDIRLDINVANLPLPDPRLKGLSGQVISRIESLNWRDAGECETVSGSVQTNILTQNKALFAWTGPVLSGPVSCDETGSFVFSLSGEDTLQKISARVSISPFGDYKSDMSVITRDEQAALVLPLFGFEDRGSQQIGQEFRLVEQGRWR